MKNLLLMGHFVVYFHQTVAGFYVVHGTFGSVTKGMGCHAFFYVKNSG